MRNSVEVSSDRVIDGNDQFRDRAVETFGGRPLQMAGRRPRDRGHEDRSGQDGQCHDQRPLDRWSPDRYFRTHCVIIPMRYYILINIYLLNILNWRETILGGKKCEKKNRWGGEKKLKKIRN